MNEGMREKWYTCNVVDVFWVTHSSKISPILSFFFDILYGFTKSGIHDNLYNICASKAVVEDFFDVSKNSLGNLAGCQWSM